MKRRQVLIGATALAASYLLVRRFEPSALPEAEAVESFPVNHTEAEWRKLLTAQQFEVLREAGTERPYSSPLNEEHRPGNFYCQGCRQAVFSSDTKFDSKTGWPSFWAPVEKAVATTRDTSYGMLREAVHCAQCGGHLGHVFRDGPRPTGLRYCMNGVAMGFTPRAS